MAENKWQPNWTTDPGSSSQLSEAGPQKLASEKTTNSKSFDAGTAEGFADLTGKGGPFDPMGQMRSMQKGGGKASGYEMNPDKP